MKTDMEVEGIKKKLSITSFFYHLTGFAQDILFNGHSKELRIVCSETQQVYYSEIVKTKELYYDDFLVVAKKMHLRMIEDNMTGYHREYKEEWEFDYNQN
jgi:hypothetical protein